MIPGLKESLVRFPAKSPEEFSITEGLVLKFIEIDILRSILETVIFGDTIMYCWVSLQYLFSSFLDCVLQMLLVPV